MCWSLSSRMALFPWASFQAEFEVDDAVAGIVVVRGDRVEAEGLIQRPRRRHRRQRVEPDRAITQAPGLGEDRFGQTPAELATAKGRPHVEPFHFADAVAAPAQGDATGGLTGRLEEQQLSAGWRVLSREPGGFRRETLKTFAVPGRFGVFAKQRSRLFDLRGRGRWNNPCVAHSHSPRRTVTAWPPRNTRSPATRTLTTPPRAEAW